MRRITLDLMHTEIGYQEEKDRRANEEGSEERRERKRAKKERKDKDRDDKGQEESKVKDGPRPLSTRVSFFLWNFRHLHMGSVLSAIRW